MRDQGTRTQPTEDLNPSGKCMGPEMKGCPYDDVVIPAEVRAGVHYVHYHCWKCIQVYRRRYG